MPSGVGRRLADNRGPLLIEWSRPKEGQTQASGMTDLVTMASKLFNKCMNAELYMQDRKTMIQNILN